MKITEITQPKKLDEAFFLPVLAAAGAGMTAYDIYKNYQAHQAGEISDAELAARVGGDVALGLIGGGILGAIKVIKGALTGAKAAKNVVKTNMRTAKSELKTAKSELKTAKELKRDTAAGTPDRAAADDLIAQARDAKKVAKEKLGNRYIGGPGLSGTGAKGAKTQYKRQYGKGIGAKAKRTGLALAVPDALDPVRNPAYRATHVALGNKVRGKQPDAGTPGTPGSRSGSGSGSLGSKPPAPKKKKDRNTYGTGLGDPEYLRNFGK